MPLRVLNRYLAEWIDNDYHTTIHSSTGEAPLVRYLRHVHLLREAPKDLDDYFRKRALRRVARDRTVALNARLYEAPLELIGKQVSLLYHDHDPARVEVYRQIAIALDTDGRSTSVTRLTKTIRDILCELVSRKIVPVLITDEANLMRLEVLA